MLLVTLVQHLHNLQQSTSEGSTSMEVEAQENIRELLLTCGMASAVWTGGVQCWMLCDLGPNRWSTINMENLVSGLSASERLLLPVARTKLAQVVTICPLTHLPYISWFQFQGKIRIPRVQSRSLAVQYVAGWYSFLQTSETGRFGVWRKFPHSREGRARPVS